MLNFEFYNPTNYIFGKNQRRNYFFFKIKKARLGFLFLWQIAVRNRHIAAQAELGYRHACG